MLAVVDDFVSIFYPKICLSCGNSLFRNENTICTICLYSLPKTHYHQNKNNPLYKAFWGKVEVSSAAAFYVYRKGNKVQQLIHQFKYRGKKHIGYHLGAVYGHELKTAPLFETVEEIVPVPLHKKKLERRGFNQSEIFARGLGSSMKIPVNDEVLFRKLASETQTKKSRYKRWENVSSIFDVKKENHLKNKHILLVDDVITTGSTLEACIMALQKIPGIRISVASIATPIV